MHIISISLRLVCQYLTEVLVYIISNKIYKVEIKYISIFNTLLDLCHVIDLLCLLFLHILQNPAIIY